MQRFTDGDVAVILTAIMVNNHRGTPTRTWDTVIAAGMPDAVYDAAYGYALRHNLIKVVGQHNGVTWAGRRFARSATVPATRTRQGRTDFPVIAEDFDQPSPAQILAMTVADE